MPRGFINALGVPDVATSVSNVMKFMEMVPLFEERNYTISGVSRDQSGVALGSCTVRLFNTASLQQEQVATSDASGNYSFVVDKTQQYFVVAYKAGSPDVAGTTVNTLAGT